MRKFRDCDVAKHLAGQGEILRQNVSDLLQENKLTQSLSISGHPSWTFLIFKDGSRVSGWELKTLFMQEILRRGVISFGTHNISFAYGADEIKCVTDVYAEVFPLLRQAEVEGIGDLLRCEPLEPLFKVR